MITRRRRFLATSIIIAAVGLLTIHLSGAAEQTGQLIKVTVGEEFSITLDSNISTGYGWQLAKPLAEVVVKAIKNAYEQPARSKPMPGEAGKEVWTFKAVGSGKTTIDFKYVRPWEKDKAPDKVASYQVIVSASQKK